MNDDARVALLAHPCRLIVIGSMLESGRIGEGLHDELLRWLQEADRETQG